MPSKLASDQILVVGPNDELIPIDGHYDEALTLPCAHLAASDRAIEILRNALGDALKALSLALDVANERNNA